MTSDAELIIRLALLPRLEELVASDKWDVVMTMIMGQPLIRHLMYAHHPLVVSPAKWSEVLSVAAAMDAKEGRLQ